MGNKLYYLATPSAHPDPLVMEDRFNIACEIAGFFLQKRIYVYGAIAHLGSIASRSALPEELSFWQEYDSAILTRCNTLLVVMMDGWKESIGINTEITIATKYNIPIYFVEYPDYQKWYESMKEKL